MRPVAARKHTYAKRTHHPISLGDLAQALDHSDEGFALTDPDGKYLYLNEAHLRIYGYERPQDLLGRSWRTLYTPEWIQHFEEGVLPGLPRDRVWRGRVIGRRRDGSTFPCGVTLTLLPDGKITCNCWDESRQNERGETNDAALVLGTRLVAGLPARLRRPLEILTAYSSFFLCELEACRPLSAQSLLEGLTEIERAGKNLAAQTRRLEILAAMTAQGRRGAEQTCADWSQPLAGACRAKAGEAGRGEDLTVDLLPAKLATSYQSLECAVLELLDNALQSSRAGQAIRIIGCNRGRKYELCMHDEGVGLPPDGLASLHSRSLGQTTPSGFGLALVRCMLNQCGGTIEACREIPYATSLRMTVPLSG